MKDTKDWKIELMEICHSMDLDRRGKVIRVTVVLSALERFIGSLLKEAEERGEKNAILKISDMVEKDVANNLVKKLFGDKFIVEDK